MLNSVVNAMLAGCTQHDGTLDLWQSWSPPGSILDGWMGGWKDGWMADWIMKIKKKKNPGNSRK